MVGELDIPAEIFLTLKFHLPDAGPVKVPVAESNVTPDGSVPVYEYDFVPIPFVAVGDTVGLFAPYTMSPDAYDRETGAYGVTWLDTDSMLSPSALLAVTLNQYSVPFVSPVTVLVVAETPVANWVHGPVLEALE